MWRLNRLPGREGRRLSGVTGECNQASSTGQAARTIDNDTTGEELTMNGYCLKCRDHREMQEAEEVTLKNGRLATRGRCGECRTTMFRMGGTTLKG